MDDLCGDKVQVPAPGGGKMDKRGNSSLVMVEYCECLRKCSGRVKNTCVGTSCIFYMILSTYNKFYSKVCEYMHMCPLTADACVHEFCHA